MLGLAYISVFFMHSCFYNPHPNFSLHQARGVDFDRVRSVSIPLLVEPPHTLLCGQVHFLPFEKMTREHDNITLIRLNLDQAVVPESLGSRVIGINADMEESIKDIFTVSVSHPYPVQAQ